MGVRPWRRRPQPQCEAGDLAGTGVRPHVWGASPEQLGQSWGKVGRWFRAGMGASHESPEVVPEGGWGFPKGGGMNKTEAGKRSWK